MLDLTFLAQLLDPAYQSIGTYRALMGFVSAEV
jgi:hypothetical protein